MDPLDGTKEFLAQNGEFSIMVGLVEDGEPVLGVVYLPDGDVTSRPRAAWARGGHRAGYGSGSAPACRRPGSAAGRLAHPP